MNDALGVLEIITDIVLETELHGPAGSFVVNVSVTVPAMISAGLGVYVDVNELGSLNIPVPVDVHVDVVAEPPIIPARVTIEPLQLD